MKMKDPQNPKPPPEDTPPGIDESASIRKAGNGVKPPGDRVPFRLQPRASTPPTHSRQSAPGRAGGNPVIPPP
jgi:hypothetical protein